MAEDKKNAPRRKKAASKGSKQSNKILVIGKIFLLVLILAGQAYLAYVIVDKYYPSIYAKMNEEKPPVLEIYQMEQLVVNPANTNGRRYLMIEINLEMNVEDIPKMEKVSPKIKQDILETLSARTVTQLTNSQERENLRNQLSEIINSSIGENSVRNLYFTKYVLQ
jgi:flagellar FliL protein